VSISLLGPPPDPALKLETLKQIKAWVRELLRVDATCLVLVTEHDCEDPDCERQTSIIVSPVAKTYLTYSISKPAAEVTRTDVLQALAQPTINP
jgi:hypothetical protein